MPLWSVKRLARIGHDVFDPISFLRQYSPYRNATRVRVEDELIVQLWMNQQRALGQGSSEGLKSPLLRVGPSESGFLRRQDLQGFR